MREPVKIQVKCCSKDGCGLRFSTIAGQILDAACPRCGSPTVPGCDPYEEHKAPRMAYDRELPRMEALLDNIRSTYNVGSMFRSADGAGISHVHLCGITPTPENPKLKKTALGADEAVAWSHNRNGWALARMLRSKGMRLWAIEGGESSTVIHEAELDMHAGPVVLVVGNEICGVDPGILDQCEKILSIPMQGIKTSLNTAVAFGIAAYTIRMHYLRK